MILVILSSSRVRLIHKCISGRVNRKGGRREGGERERERERPTNFSHLLAVLFFSLSQPGR